MNTIPQFHQLSFSGGMLQRGFWLYVWEITTHAGDQWLYVGRTGDSASLNAQSPFARMSQHLGTNVRTNALIRNLSGQGIKVELCKSFRLSSYGPILSETPDEKGYRERRDQTAALEKKLRDALTESGYKVLNSVACRKVMDEELWHQVQKAFSEAFPKLKYSSPHSKDGR